MQLLHGCAAAVAIKESKRAGEKAGDAAREDAITPKAAKIIRALKPERPFLCKASSTRRLARLAELEADLATTKGIIASDAAPGQLKAA